MLGHKNDILSCYWSKPVSHQERFADVVAVAVPQVADGLSGDEILALAAEGQIIQPKRRATMMDWMMKIVMGGWIPQGKRSQILAFVTALTAMVMVFLDWGSGTMDFMHFMEAMKEKWMVLVAAYGVFFVAEKVDAKK